MEFAVAAAKATSAWDEPGTLGFIMVFGMAVILFFVFRSLTKHLRKINEAARLEAAQAESGQDAVQPVPGAGSEGPAPVNGIRPTV